MTAVACLFATAMPAYATSDSDTCEMFANIASVPMKFYQDGLNHQQAKQKAAEFVKKFDKFPEQQKIMAETMVATLDVIYVKEKGSVKIGKTQQEKDKAVTDYAVKMYQTCMAD